MLEWLALGEALQNAGAGFCMIELGAGYGPWLVRAGVAWRHRRGGAPLRLVGVEGEPAHAAYLRQHAIDNGLAEVLSDLRVGAVSTMDGEAAFEVSPRPAEEWGTRLVGGVDIPRHLPRVPVCTTVHVPCWSLTTLMQGLPAVDLLHVDIQGSEAAVLLAASAALAEDRVRRLLVGTHGPEIDVQLAARLPALGFELRAEKSCVYRGSGDDARLAEDGGQYWVAAAPSGTIAPWARSSW